MNAPIVRRTDILFVVVHVIVAVVVAAGCYLGRIGSIP